ncbi:hypothetical protein GCM10010269_12740 [Streptomyces humidus]|uniref:Uncharacterized protein n=1 Tax=Streptomyces humidus TaxID=52259 RepID=A0A918L1V6_9ACTN|nr:hypothetical protein GCM10010269_12740 [Streptomyces humidus]
MVTAMTRLPAAQEAVAALRALAAENARELEVTHDTGADGLPAHRRRSGRRHRPGRDTAARGVRRNPPDDPA